MTTLNLTQHPASDEQRAAGVEEPADKAAVKALLTFAELPSSAEIRERAAKLAELASGHDKAMVGGAPFLMHALHDALVSAGVTPVYAFSRRESVEQVDEDGTVTKRSIFRHLGFVDAP